MPRPFIGERTIFSTNATSKTEHPHAKEPSFTPYTTQKSNLKWIKNINVRAKSIKILGENKG